MKTNNVYQLVTDRIVEKMKEGIIPWHQPWAGGLGECAAINYVTRKPYSSLNQMLLGRAGEWLTFKQVKAAGGSIKQGEKGSMVVYYQYGFDTKEERTDPETGEVKEHKVHVDVPVLRYYNVWHISQCEGIESKLQPAEEAPASNNDPIESAEQAIKLYVEREDTLTFSTNGSSAYYRPSTDDVVVPALTIHESAEEFYSTAFHELVHSTGHPKRLDRLTLDGTAAFGSEKYSKEELVAEIGSAFAMFHLGIDCAKAFNNSVAYIQGWIKHLTNHPKCIVHAASQAEKAVTYIFTGEKPDYLK